MKKFFKQLFCRHKWYGTYAFRSTDRPGEHQEHWQCLKCQKPKSLWVQERPVPDKSKGLWADTEVIVDRRMPEGTFFMIPTGPMTNPDGTRIEAVNYGERSWEGLTPGITPKDIIMYTNRSKQEGK